MASPFQRYTSGIEASTGNLVPAAGQMAAQTFNALSGLGQSIGQGIQLYAENQRKSEAADATIASGIARFKSISDVYGQDPEFAPIVAQFAQRLEQYKDAPNQSYAKKAVMANEIGMLGQDLAQTIQAQQVVRGRQIERVGGELLNQFPNVQKVTDPAFIKEGTSKFNTGRDYGANEGEFLAGLNKFRQAAQAAGKEIKGSDAEALDAYRRDVLDSTNKAMSAGTLDKGIGSRIIEQVEAQRSIEKKNAQAQSDMPMLPSQMRSSRKDYESVTGTAYQAPEQAQAAVDDRVLKAYAPIKAQVNKELNDLTERETSLTTQVQEEKRLANLVGGKSPVVNTAENMWNNFAVPAFRGALAKYSKVGEDGEISADWGKLLKDASSLPALVGTGPVGTMLASSGAFDPEKPLAERVKIAKSVEEKVKKSGPEAELADVQSRIRSLKSTLGGIQTSEVQKPAGPAPAPAPVLSLGKMNVGQVEYERKVNQAEKKAKIADLMTQRIGIVDPATGKKSLPAGFDAYYKKMVPESDARVVDIDGIKLFWDGSKLEQVKQQEVKAPTAKEIGETSAYTFGIQTANGIQPTELVPNSGILIGGIVSAASTTVADKVREQLTDMIDLRGSISRLTEINDKFGESLNLRDQGISQYDLMKLRAVLTKQINVSGSISDEERRAINKMTPDPTAFLDLEPKTRAGLLGIAQGIDRDIKTLATSRGLSVVMTGNSGMSQNQSLRQKFLSEQSK
jgi:hypothetical protein